MCLVGLRGELMGLEGTGKGDDMRLVPISTTQVETGPSKRVQSYPPHSVFVIVKQVGNALHYSLVPMMHADPSTNDEAGCRGRIYVLHLWVRLDCSLSLEKGQQRLCE